MEYFADIIEDYRAYGNNPFFDLLENMIFEDQPKCADSKAKLSGLTFVITGSLNDYANREELISVIEANDGKISSSISSKTSYLINNDSTSTSGKNKKAKELGIPVITEIGFAGLLL